jgi:hypothetical protein
LPHASRGKEDPDDDDHSASLPLKGGAESCSWRCCACPFGSAFTPPVPRVFTLAGVDFLGRLGRRQLYVATYDFPAGLDHEFRRRYPKVHSLDSGFRAFRQWLRLQVVAKETLAMPSLAVDQLWHEFILHTVAYDEFCARAYGRKLHHHPEAAMSDGPVEEANGRAMAYTFALACTDENIRPHEPDRLPLLFSVDAILRVRDGRRWKLNCGATSCEVAVGRCAWHDLVPLIPRRLPEVLPLNAAGQMELEEPMRVGFLRYYGHGGNPYNYGG